MARLRAAKLTTKSMREEHRRRLDSVRQCVGAAVAITALAASLHAASGVASVDKGSRSAGSTRARCRGIYWRTMRDGSQICPRSHSLLADRAFSALRWSSWSSSGARARGYYICTDSACYGQLLAHVLVKLSKVHRCPDGVRIFTRFDAYFSPRAPETGAHWGWRIACNGTAGGGGG